MTGQPERVSSKVHFEGRFFQVSTETFLGPDGQTVEREIVRHPGAVAVVAVMDGNLLMVRQMRHAVLDPLLEVPAGKLEPDEDPWDTARRELMEETGFACDSLELLASYYSSPGFTDERFWTFYTDSLRKVSEPPEMDGDEPIQVQWVPLDGALDAIKDGRIADAKTIIGITMLLLRDHQGESG